MLEILDIECTSRWEGQQTEPAGRVRSNQSCKKGSFQSRKSSDSTVKGYIYNFQAVNEMSVFKNYLAGIYQIESDSYSHGHGIIERSKLRNLCQKWKHIFGPRLTFTCKNMIKADMHQRTTHSRLMHAILLMTRPKL